MKKLLTLIACAVVLLLSGIVLSACGSTRYFISFAVEQPDMVNVEVEIDDKKVLTNLDGKIEALTSSRVRVKFYAKQYGVDMDGIVVKANNKVRKVEKFNTHFDSLHPNGDLYFGYIYLEGQNEDVKITVSGAKSVENKVTFEIANNQDETAKERMQHAKIKLPNQNDFQNFSDFINSSDRTLTFNLLGLGNFSRSFQLQFDGGNPYSIDNSTPFQIKHADSSLSDIENVSYADGIYTFDLGDLGNETDMRIVSDFQALQCKEFELDLASNMSYSVTIDDEKDTLDFETEATITVQKKSASITFDKANLKGYLNTHQLEMIEEDLPEDTVKFRVPKWLTPTGTGGTDVFRFRLEGVDFGDGAVVLQTESEDEHSTKLFNSEIYTLDENGEKAGVLGYNGDGDVITFAEKTNILEWNYNVFGGLYYTPYQLYNYDVMLNGEKLLNVDQILKGQAEQFREGKPITHGLTDGMTFKAEFNEETGKYDSFKLEFMANKDMTFSFVNFQKQRKKIDIDCEISDPRVLSVEYAVSQDSSIWEVDWINLRVVGKKYIEDVEYGDVVMFRLQVTQPIAENEFRLEETIACNSQRDAQNYSIENQQFLVLIFNISDIYFDTTQSIKLVPSFAVGV